MNGAKKTALSLFLMRLSVFVVFLIWTLDKFLRPEHAATVFQNYYFFPALPATVTYAIGAVEMVLIVGFLLGIQKTFTYGFVLLLQVISTVSCYKQYLAPFEGPNILLFAGWPMLAACYALFVLREEDKLFSLK